jgi:stage II sporulation protein P
VDNQIKNTASKNEFLSWLIMIMTGIFLISVGMVFADILFISKHNIPYSSVGRIHGLARLDTETSKYILKKGLPFLEVRVDEDDPITFFQINWNEVYWRFAANVTNTTPLEIVRTQFPLLAFIKIKPKVIIQPEKIPVEHIPQVADQPELPENEPHLANITPELTGDPAVFIYHTHSTESYIPTSGKDHLNNQAGDVVKVGSYLKQVLEEKYQLKSVHSELIHDTVPFRDSYNRSHITVKDYLKKYPATKVIIDIHRDATPGISNTCIINGVKSSTIAFVVGSDKMGLPHPHWKENYEFVKKLNENMNLYYQGLCNGIIISDARYNQHMHTHAILVEFGNQFSAFEEAHNAVNYFAEVLALTLNSDPLPGRTMVD